MDHPGIRFCCRYAYPPNSLSLCGPDKQTDLIHYVTTGRQDAGTVEILGAFATMYPYLKLIAGANRIRDPFDHRVVEAYWIGNRLLEAVPIRPFVDFLDDGLGLHRKLPSRRRTETYDKIAHGGRPHHSFHVMNVYVRTGNMDIPHTVATMDACIINAGTVTEKFGDSFIVTTRPIVLSGNKLVFGDEMRRNIRFTATYDQDARDVKIGDTIAYHWGYFCTILSAVQRDNLLKYTGESLAWANTTL